MMVAAFVCQSSSSITGSTDLLLFGMIFFPSLCSPPAGGSQAVYFLARATSLISLRHLINNLRILFSLRVLEMSRILISVGMISLKHDSLVRSEVWLDEVFLAWGIVILIV